MSSGYINWLKTRGVRLFDRGGISWKLYRGSLVPASVAPCFVELDGNEAGQLLKESGAFLLRYTSDPCENQTEWWYVMCDSFETGRLSSKMRNQIRFSSRHCSVRRIDALWLSTNGYGCYSNAFKRYDGSSPISREDFYENIMATYDGPFEYWGVFVGNSLAGYCQCIIEGKNAATNVIKSDPVFLKFYSSYALISALVTNYIVNNGMSLSNGSRSVSHDTNIQDFLLKFGFRKQFCRLNVVYRPWLKAAVRSLYPFNGLIGRLPDKGPVQKIKSVLFQERLRRACHV